MDKEDNVKISLTITPETEEYLKETYPDALDLQHGVRHAISDSRLLRATLSHIAQSDGGRLIEPQEPEGTE
jgi:hypothetical protein